MDETDIFVDNTNSSLAIPHRENSLRQRKKRMLAHSRLPGTKAILIREIPKQSVWKPQVTENEEPKSTLFPGQRVLRQASINRRARSDGFNLTRRDATESCPLLSDIDEVRSNQLEMGEEAHLSISLSDTEKELLDSSSVPAIDLSSELSSSSAVHTPSKAKASPHSVRSKPLPAYVPSQDISRRSSRARASHSGAI